MTTPTHVRLAGASLLIVAFAAPVPAAQAAAPTKVLTVVSEGTAPVALTIADLRNLPRTRAEVKDEGRTIVYEGVLVGEVLKRVGAPLGAAMRGNALTTYVVATASDGYQVVFSLGELDPAMSNSEIIVADTIDGKPLFDYQGPFRLVAPRDTRGARSVRMLERLELRRTGT